ncbi:hypothetical protein DMUE_0789 [Dictyocoela muelleri]|nr:hypothetical protein DMUE_0789 [Dictyocoela muelleri]
MKNLLSYTALTKIVSKYSFLKKSKNELVCTICNKKLNYSQNDGTKSIRRHILSQTHVYNEIRNSEQMTLLQTCSMSSQNIIFDNNLIEAFTSANIPLFKLQNSVLSDFIQKYTGHIINDESYYRKLMVPIYENRIRTIFSKFKGEDILLMFDETTDVNGRFVLNILGVFCSKISRQKIFLLRTIEL